MLRRERDYQVNPPSASGSGSVSVNDVSGRDDAFVSALEALKRDGETTRRRVGVLERGYEDVLKEIVGVQRGMGQQDGLIQGIIGGLLGSSPEGEVVDGFVRGGE